MVASLPNGPVDMWGDLPTRSEKDIDEFYATNMSDSVRYQYQFLGRKTWLKTGRGILGIFETKAPIGESCLANTAFDITASEIEGRAYGDISAIASIARNENEEIVVYPASAADPLEFTIENTGRLDAANVATERTLSSYGCLG